MGRCRTGQRERSRAGSSCAPREVMIVLPGLLMAILLAMLDNLIVSTALPRIVGDLGGVAHLSWVVTAYILASTITTPFYGKLGDMYGRKKFFVAAIIIFLAGSALSGLSQSMAELIAFRAIQGLGAGGLMVGAMATLGDIVAPRERGRYMSYMMVVMMLATIGGPLLGGFITTSFSWRWIFYINIPLGGAALVYLLATLHVPAHKVSHKVDYLGGSLLAVAATALILLATWGGTQYAWGSPQIIGLALLTVAAGVAFCVTEMQGRRADDAAARLPQPELLPVDGDDLPHRPGHVRRDDVPAAVPADGAGRVADRQRPGADADDARRDRHLDRGRPGDHQDRPVQGVPDPRRRHHGPGHVPAHRPGRRHHRGSPRRSSTWSSASAWASSCRWSR